MKLAPEEKATLLQVVDDWLHDVTGDGLPDGILALRNALQDDADRGEL